MAEEKSQTTPAPDGNQPSANASGPAPAVGAKAEAKGPEMPPEKVAFKPHPLLDRKKRRSSTIGNLRQSERNPMMLTLEQHEGHRLRVAKACAALFALLLLALASYFYLDNLKAKRRVQAQVDGLKREQATIESAIASATGYERDQAVLQVINLCLRAALIDVAGSEQWLARIKRYQDQLNSTPAPGRHFVVPSALVDLVNIPRGRFNMGRRAKEPGRHEELPRHLVVIPYEFWMARTEITNAQFRRFFRQHRTVIPGWENYRFDQPHQPVAYLDWHAASEYCRMVGELEEQAGRVPKGYEYRLPTEAEWEYACRAGTETYYYWGDEFGNPGATYANILDEYSRVRLQSDKKEAGRPLKDGFTVTSPVGRFQPNAFGLHDMSGNVWEWCWDWYNPSAYRELFSTAPVQSDPIEATIERLDKWGSAESVKTTSKIIRGGCWGSSPTEARSATRDSAVPETKNSGIGFRLVLAPKIKIINSGVLEDQILKGATMPDLAPATPTPETPAPKPEAPVPPTPAPEVAPPTAPTPAANPAPAAPAP